MPGLLGNLCYGYGVGLEREMETQVLIGCCPCFKCCPWYSLNLDLPIKWLRMAHSARLPTGGLDLQCTQYRNSLLTACSEK